MTISISWQRKFLGVNEIIFASDSRLSAGYRWDCAQKIFPIDGPNFCISFAGNADFAFPCIFQFQIMVKNYPKFADGAGRIQVLAKDFNAIVNQLFEIVDDQMIAQFSNTQFLFSGFDFETGESYQKIIQYNLEKDSYVRENFSGIQSGGVNAAIGFAGDFRELFFQKLGKIIATQKTELDYQPLQVLNEIIMEQDLLSSVGGKPQIVKVYKHRNYLPYAVKDNLESEDIYLFGRPLLTYEKTLYPIAALDRIGHQDFIHYPVSTPNRILTGPPNTDVD